MPIKVTMASVKVHSDIQKLNDTNYQMWKFKMEMLLTYEKLNHVFSDIVEMVVDNESLKQLDQRARALIALHVGDSQINHILHERTAKSTWQKLQYVHERTCLSNRLFLLRQLYSMRYNEDGNMNDYLKEVFQIVEKLRCVGECVPDTQLWAQHASTLLLLHQLTESL